MTGAFKVEPAELDGYGELLKRNAGHFLTIKEHATTKGGDTSGFTGLLALLIPVVDVVVDLYGRTLDFANEKMIKDAEGLAKAADAYEKIDKGNGEKLDLLEQALNALPGAPVAGGGK